MKNMNGRASQTLQLCTTLVYLAIGGFAGSAARIYLGLLFGGACEKPETVSWGGSWAPCITNSGLSTPGGALFLDIIANMVGSFFMGLLQRGAQLQLDNDLPLAFLPASSSFQEWSELHLGLRTGFCGSLTTFASWNNQMVIMACGGKGTVQSTQWLAALVGYIIGMEVALTSFHLGKHVALLLHSFANPKKLLERESFVKNASLLGVNVKDFEARFLNDNITQEEIEKAKSIGLELDQLSKWKESTAQAQVAGAKLSFDKLSFLMRIQSTILREGTLEAEEQELAKNMGLNTDVLQQWVDSTSKLRKDSQPQAISSPFGSFLKKKAAGISLVHYLVLLLYVGVNAALVTGIVLEDSDTVLSRSRRARFCAVILAPFGVVTRWYLSNFNGKLPGTLSWFPIGTFLANMLASSIDAILAAVELYLSVRDGQVNYWTSIWFPAVEKGFSGSLSTVSTFVGEVSTLMFNFPQSLHGYTYMAVSLVSAFVLGLALYGWSAW